MNTRAMHQQRVQALNTDGKEFHERSVTTMSSTKGRILLGSQTQIVLK